MDLFDNPQDGYDFPVPEELRPWLEHLQENCDCNLAGYILENGKIKKTDYHTAMLWFAQNFEARIVEKTTVGEADVSTVFLPASMNFSETDTRPILFETMIFGGDYDCWQHRYRSWGGAKNGHWSVVAALREGRKPNHPNTP